MNFSPETFHRRSIRLKGYDYSQANSFFITICVQNRLSLFGEIEDGSMILNESGRMVEKWIKKLESKFHDIQCHEYVIMPNHIHLIIHNVGADPCVWPLIPADPCVCPLIPPDPCVWPHCEGEHTGNLGEHTGSPLRDVIRWLKTMTTNEYIRNVKYSNWQSFHEKLWQRNYYEHVIKDDKDLNRIRDYIINNPVNWMRDKNNI